MEFCPWFLFYFINWCGTLGNNIINVGFRILERAYSIGVILQWEWEKFSVLVPSSCLLYIDDLLVSFLASRLIRNANFHFSGGGQYITRTFSARCAPYHMNTTIKIYIRIIDINAYDINQNDNIIYQFLKTILIIHITNHN